MNELIDESISRDAMRCDVMRWSRISSLLYGLGVRV